MQLYRVSAAPANEVRTMHVRQLVGPYAGKIVTMPHHVATACISNGTAEVLTEAETYAHQHGEPLSTGDVVAVEVTPTTHEPEVAPPGARAKAKPRKRKGILRRG